MYNVKSIPIQALPESAWRVLSGQPLDNEDRLNANSAYKLVPVFYRAVDIRASAVARMPLKVLDNDGNEVQQKGDTAKLVDTVRSLLYLTEASIVLTGKSYWLLERNALGMNDTPRWLLPSSINPKFETKEGLVSFERQIGKDKIILPLEDVVYWWAPNLEAESGPGPGAASRALAAASALRNQDLYVSGYFSRGALRNPVIRVPGNPSDSEKGRIKAFFSRLMGVRRSFEPEVINDKVEIDMIGDALKDTVNPTLTEQERADVLMSLGVPLSLVLANAANYATANQDYLSFYTLTIIPEMDSLILPSLNKWLAKRGYRIVGAYEQLEVMQAQQLAQAQAVSALVGQPIMTVNEGRAFIGLPPLEEQKPGAGAEDATKTEHPILGYHIEQGVVSSNEARAALGLPPRDEDADERLRRLQGALAVVNQATGAGIDLEAALRMVGLDVPGARPKTAPQKPPGGPGAAQGDQGQPAPDSDTQKRAGQPHSPAVCAELGRWERKAIKRWKERGRADVEFSSSLIEPHRTALIKTALAAAGSIPEIKAAFKADGGRLLTELEQRLYKALALTLATHGSETARQIMRGQAVDLAALGEDLQAALLPILTEVFAEQISDLEARWAVELPASGATGSAAAEWAERYTFGLIKNLNATTQKLVQRAIATYTSTPGMTLAQVEAQLAPAFGPVRAELIAVSEITRAASAAQSRYQTEAAAAGINLVRIWRTNADELVCSVCAPLNGKPESVWVEVHPDGPGAHPGCRCTVTLELADDL